MTDDSLGSADAPNDDHYLFLISDKPQASVVVHPEGIWWPAQSRDGKSPELQFHLGERNGRQLHVWVFASLSTDFQVLPLRTVLANSSPDDAQSLQRAVSYNHWRATHRYCGTCGQPTRLRRQEFVLDCPGCGAEAYPRISPCVIMLVHRGEEILLARHARSLSRPVFSCLAGYVEVGETLEQTVVREVREEVGVEIGNPVYVESQPWPFPSQLMAGFFAPWKSGEPVPDGNEILEAGWYRRSQLPLLPPELSLARRLVRRFYNDPEL